MSSSMLCVTRSIFHSTTRNNVNCFRRSYHNINNSYFIHPYNQLKSAVSLSSSESSVPMGYVHHPGINHNDLVKSSSKEFLDSIEESQFEENPKFRLAFFDFLSKNIHKDFSYQLEASEYALNFMPIYDFRHIPEYGRRSQVDDIFGWINVDRTGEMVKGSFQANDMYRIFTKSNGFPKLTDYLKENIEEFT